MDQSRSSCPHLCGHRRHPHGRRHGLHRAALCKFRPKIPGHRCMLPLDVRQIGVLTPRYVTPVLRCGECENHAVVHERGEQHHEHIEHDVKSLLEPTAIADRLHQPIEGAIECVGHGGEMVKCTKSGRRCLSDVGWLSRPFFFFLPPKRLEREANEFRLKCLKSVNPTKKRQT